MLTQGRPRPTEMATAAARPEVASGRTSVSWSTRPCAIPHVTGISRVKKFVTLSRRRRRAGPRRGQP